MMNDQVATTPPLTFVTMTFADGEVRVAELDTAELAVRIGEAFVGKPRGTAKAAEFLETLSPKLAAPIIAAAASAADYMIEALRGAKVVS